MTTDPISKLNYSLVIIESPFAPDPKLDTQGQLNDSLNKHSYLDQCIRDCIGRNESPYASHLMLTTALDDRNIEQRTQGIEAGLAWKRVADKTVFYLDLGESTGMKLARSYCVQYGFAFEDRFIR